MKKQKIKIFLFAAIFGALVLLAFQGLKGVRAGGEHNVSGWAWSENIGWTSFNNTSGGGTVNYGVDTDSSTGVFSGYSWSENIGWISFNESELSGCPGSPCRAWADLSCPGDQCPVYGWARALAGGTSEAGGWDGWIKLRDSNYGAWIDPTVSPAEFHGWVWGGNQTDGDWQDKAVVGWISFNCAEGGATGGNICGKSNYKVVTSFAFNQPPEARNLSVDQGNYCEFPYPPVFLSWEFYDPDGDTQSAYQVQVDNNSDFSSPDVDSGKVSSSSQAYAPANLSYSITYYWRVKVWDSQDTESAWAVGPSFTTFACHPTPDFIWSPSPPTIGEAVQFTDESVAYGGASIVSWSWVFENGDPATSIEQNPLVVFGTTGPENKNQVTLSVADSYGNSCPVTKLIDVALPLPEWIEIRPF